jgi:hypothetical protein
VNTVGDSSREHRVVRTLKDGYWDHTAVIELPDGSHRVLKQTKGEAFGPWGVRSLRREIQYLTSLPESARGVFPPVLAAWDGESTGAPGVGYEMPFYSDHLDAGELARRAALTQEEIDDFQDALADAVLARLHKREAPDEPLSAHVTSVVAQAWDQLEKDPILAALLNAEDLTLNGDRILGPRAALARIKEETDLPTRLDTGPSVRLHGDLFLENILWRPSAIPALNAQQLILIDPVSVAGVMCGPPVFDLVKYVSYATGELLALRSERVEVECPASGEIERGYHYRIRWEDPALQPFRAFDWHSRFQRAFEDVHGPVDASIYQLIDGYFSAAMAVNTSGMQQIARLLKATVAFNAALKNS